MTSYDPLRKQLVTLIVFHVLITDILSDSLTPNLLNVVQNRHIRFLPHTKKVCVHVGATEGAIAQIRGAERRGAAMVGVEGVGWWTDRRWVD